MKEKIDQYFGITKSGSTFKRELTGGVTAFLAMSYVIFVNPIILGQAGMPQDAVFMSTILSSAIAMLVMGLWARFPLGLAPCMSMNAFFAYSVVLQMGKTWQEALSTVLVSSILFILLAISGLRSTIIKAIPVSVKQAGTVGLGIFIAFVSFKNSGIIVPDEGMFITFGGFHDPNVIIAFFGLTTAAYFLIRKNQYAVFLGMIGAAICGLFIRFGASMDWFHLSESVVAGLPQLPSGSPVVLPTQPMQSMLDETFLVAVTTLPKMLSADSIIVILTFLFLDFFGTATTLSAAATQVSDIKRESFEDNKRIYSADAIGSFVGSIFGTSSLSTYIESVSGIIAGARTGLMSVIVAILFLLSTFFYPVLSLVTPAVTTPAMVVIGIFMMQNITSIKWDGGFEEIIPAFLTIVMMPLTGSIALGLVLGFLSYEICMIFAKRFDELPPVMHLISLISLAYLFTL
ncbi:NCS2 family permease [Enterococcus lemanii]|uniref:NCS2 family permease n=1 Tax=Enterococcus lemanii TaxID=1159752 RepID=A0ABV9N0C6_9ENTE|nr:NCS2 family permease [Enterococcus lemanii]MBM7708272.1 AGZA family xanthine/uracil permease-like MFS transporter [Enterococcus lemanii]